MSLISPMLWQGLPFEHEEAALDFYGSHDLWHMLLARISKTTPEYRFDQLNDMGDIHQRVHEALAHSFGLSAPSDFSLYDLTQRSGWVLFQQVHSLEHQRLRVAAGV